MRIELEEKRSSRNLYTVNKAVLVVEYSTGWSLFSYLLELIITK
jgi:hypothetical protein